MIDLSTKKHIHIVGIGGISNSAIAEILQHRGHKISGSDLNRTPITEHLADMGMKISYRHLPENIHKEYDAVVYTAAVSLSNPELMEAHRLGIPIYSRAEMLGFIMSEYPRSIAVSGSHGKTTTTSMISHILNDAQTDPTMLVGGIFHDTGSNVKIGKGELFITEACEYKDSFLEFRPTTGVILNIDEDHMDYFQDLDAIVRSFTRFAASLPENGYLILNLDDENTNRLLHKTPAKEITFSLENTDATYYTKKLLFDKDGTANFEIHSNTAGGKLCDINLSVPGTHNVYNALAAFATAHLHGIDPARIASGLGDFINADRRFQYRGSKSGIAVIDDYAHHPSEIRATYDIVQRKKEANPDSGNTIVVFQPHTYSRTKAFLNEFIDALKQFDIVILVDIYAARETPIEGINAKKIADGIIGSIYAQSKENAAEIVSKIAKSGDTVILMGAGDINQIAPLLI